MKGDVQETQDDFLTVQDVASRLRLAPSWVYDQARRASDPLPHYKIGKYLRFRWSDVLVWIESRRRGSEKRKDSLDRIP